MMGISSSFVWYIGMKIFTCGWTLLLHPCGCMSLAKCYIWVIWHEYHELISYIIWCMQAMCKYQAWIERCVYICMYVYAYRCM